MLSLEVSFSEVIEAIVDIVVKTGIIFLPLFLVGVIGWFFALDVWFFLRREKVKTVISTPLFKEGFTKNDFSLIAQQFPQKKGIDFLFLRTLYENRHASQKTVISLYNDMIINYISGCFAKLSSIKILAATAPLLGLLGTVNGMVTTFKVISNYGNSNASLLAEGISEALLTTQAGLTMSFPLLLVHVFLRMRLSRIKRNIDKYYNEFHQLDYH